MAGDIFINLRQGTYCLYRAVSLDESDGGSNGHFVVYQAYANDRALIVGGQPVSG